MILGLAARWSFTTLFTAASLLGACSRHDAKKAGDAAPQTDGAGDQTPPPDDEDEGEDAPGQAEGPGDKSVKNTPSAGQSKPKSDQKADPKSDPKAKTVDPTVASIQANLLNISCVRCHQGERPRAGLVLTNLQGRLDGTAPDSYRGNLVVPGEPDASMLLLVLDPGVTHSPDLPVMPPLGSGLPVVTAAQAEAVRAFIKDLAPGGDGRGDAPGPDITL